MEDNTLSTKEFSDIIELKDKAKENIALLASSSIEKQRTIQDLESSLLTTANKILYMYEQLIAKKTHSKLLVRNLHRLAMETIIETKLSEEILKKDFPVHRIHKYQRCIYD